MCFSATASFGASAAIGVIGVIAVTKAKTNPEKRFACIPLIFAFQQFTEGLIWLSLNDSGIASWRSALTYIYLVFAMAVWPFWISYTVRLLETDDRRKRILNFLVGIGSVVAITVGFVLFLYPVEALTPPCFSCPASASPSVIHNLHYKFAFPPFARNLIGIFTVLYIMATIVTTFVSGIRKMKWLGAGFLVSYLFAVIFFNGFVLSVWCFFAAILSLVVLWIIRDLQKSPG